MSILIINRTNGALTFGGVDVSAQSQVEVPDGSMLPLAADGAFRMAIMAGQAAISDGVCEYGGSSALQFLDSLTTITTTQFEKDDKDLKLASAIATVDAITGTANVLLRVPGTPGSGDGRYVAGGMAWFESENINDRVMVYVVDHDNILGYGVDFVVKSYTDDDMPADQQGWRVPVKRGFVEVEPIAGYGFMPSGFYIKCVGQRDPALVTGGKFVLNVFWGKKA